ncbi:hypothetical protein ABH933_001232 [Nocardia sp. GP40]|uniref:hypothetical protein n=1 Tax=Nocardia sp. GP40 TaxID=3156268 RepID=UPI003D2531E6
MSGVLRRVRRGSTWICESFLDIPPATPFRGLGSIEQARHPTMEGLSIVIDWDTIGQERFDRLVEALINRRYDTDEVTAVNGRGGDGGIDLDVRQGDRVSIFQLKYFPEGFSGGFIKRRGQITRSYKKMLGEKPDEWVLVVPNNLTPPERKFVDGLGKGSATPRRRVIDRKELDALLIEFPDIDRWFQRDPSTELRSNAEIFNREVDSLLRPDDLGDRVRALGELSDTVDPDWTYDFHRDGDIVSEIMRPKHHRAQIVSPIHINLRGQFGPQHAELFERFQRRFRFGTAETVELPAETVDSVEVTGPEHIARQFGSSTVIIDPGDSTAPGVGRMMEVRFFDEHGNVLATDEGRITHLGLGTHGFSLDAAFYGDHLSVRITFPVGPGPHQIPTTAHASYKLDGARPRTVADVLRLARLLYTAFKMEVVIEDNLLLSVTNQSGNEVDCDALILEEFAADLDIVQQRCGKYFALPDTISALDRIEVRVARILIEGGIVAAPRAHAVTITLSGTDSPELRASMTAREVPVLIGSEDYAVSLAGRTLSIGPVWLFHRAAAAVNPAAAIAALEVGEAAGITIDYEPVTDPYFLAASAELPEERLYNQPQTLWELTGISQPRHKWKPEASPTSDASPAPEPGSRDGVA